MRFLSALGIAAAGLVTLAQGLTVTNPKEGDTLYLHQPYTVTWTLRSVVEPANIDIYLVNNGTNFAKPLADNVAAGLESYTVDLAAVGFDGPGYQISLIPTPDSAGQGALSGKFDIVD
ncbi:hypothetical protein VTN00DRAFT_3899 [Thermoascus crustaceus]|uniref:uncharacterized protein n=1 Tax=Thermoascus crustaceus TaxID=5088 RepID=UPI003742D1CF